MFALSFIISIVIKTRSLYIESQFSRWIRRYYILVYPKWNSISRYMENGLQQIAILNKNVVKFNKDKSVYSVNYKNLSSSVL